MRNKRGNLLTEQTLKLVISVICIGFLVYFLLSLYFNHASSQNLEFAESSLNSFADEIKLSSAEIEIYNPKDWYVLSWPFNDEIPKVCSNKGWASCICICEKSPWDSFLKTCEKGVCLESDLIIEGDKNNIKIENPPLILEIDYTNKKISKVQE